MAYAALGLKMIDVGGAVGTPPGNVRNVYHYATDDAIATVVASGYFNAEVARLQVGDVIICSCAALGTGTLCVVAVAGNTGTVVTTAKAA